MQRFLFLLTLFIPVFLGAAEHSFPKEYKPPILSAGAIIEVYDKEGNLEGIVLIKRGKEPLGKALPGGKVEYGETVEHAVRRGIKEETDLDLHELRQFHVYSEPSRDPRWHTVKIIYLAKAYKKPKTGDDEAVKAYLVSLERIPWDELAFDHAQILKDYMTYREGQPEILMIKPE